MNRTRNRTGSPIESEPDTDCSAATGLDDEDASRLTEKLRDAACSPERQGLSGSRGRRPWFQAGIAYQIGEGAMPDRCRSVAGRGTVGAGASGSQVTGRA